MHKPFVYFGTPYVARDTLDILESKGLIPSLIVSTPDAPKGRGLVLTPSETKQWALDHRIPVITPEKLDAEAVAEIRSYECAYALVVAYGKFLPESLLNAFPLGVLNIHYSLLPKYRGASPVEAALLNNDNVTGVTIQRMAKEMDAGDIIATEEVAILPTETTRELRGRLITIGAELFSTLVSRFELGELPNTPQDASLATFCGKMEKSDGELSLTDDGQQNWNKYRAYAENPGTYFFTEKNGKQVRVKIKSAEFVNGVFIPVRVTPEGKNEMNYSDFVR